MTPSLSVLVGPMLGAGFLYVEGEMLERDHVRREDRSHRFWARRDDWRVERSDGMVFVDGPDGSATQHGTRLLESDGQRHPAGFHLPDRLLRPVHAHIWGRPGEDRRLSETITDVGHGRVRIALVPTGKSDTGEASVEVEVDTGRLWTLATPAFTWTITRLDEEERQDAGRLFTWR